MSPLVRSLTRAMFLVMVTGVVAMSQSQPKSITKVDPVFPEGAKNYIYGQDIQVSVEIDKRGKVLSGVTYGVYEPCADRNDSTLKAIRAAALQAATSTAWGPILDEKGQPTAARLNLSYRLPNDELRQTVFANRILNYKAKALPKPAFPPGVKFDSYTDSVMIAVLLNGDGTVLSAGSFSGPQELMDAAIDAACHSRFTSTIVAGKPVKVRGYIRYDLAP